jgi:hypothetical protein
MLKSLPRIAKMLGMSASLTVAQSEPNRGFSKQLSLLEPVTNDWERLCSEDLRLDERGYRLIAACYRDVYESFLPGPNAEPFFTQVAKQITAKGLEVSHRQVIDLVRRARALGIKDFPDIRERAISSHSRGAKRLRSPAGPRLSLEVLSSTSLTDWRITERAALAVRIRTAIALAIPGWGH